VRIILRDGRGYSWIAPMSACELEAHVRSLPDRRLSEAYQRACAQPRSEWYRLLSEEISRRDVTGPAG